MDRRNFIIRGIGAAIIAANAPMFISSLISDAPIFPVSGLQIARNPSFVSIDTLSLSKLLKELYVDNDPYKEFLISSESFFSALAR